MKLNKVCLFTAHAPSIGGGSTILRSLIENLPDISITWKYTNRSVDKNYEEGYIGPGVMGGKILNDVWETWRMLSDAPVDKINKIVDILLEVDCDSYWVVSHNEGLRVALELKRRQSTRPVHMTVHDDWAGALCARSYRYRLFSNLANSLTTKALQNVNSLDVISIGMRDYYKRLSGVEGKVCHRYISMDLLLDAAKDENPGNEIKIGHIGSLYSNRDFFSFLKLVSTFFSLNGKTVKVQMWGCSLKNEDLPAEVRNNVVFHKTLPEEQVIPKLAECEFVYSMYPFQSSLKLFGETSLPTKLTSYVQSGRPILGHGPGNCTLDKFLSVTQTGLFWNSKDQQDGFKVLEDLLKLSVTREQWAVARNQYFGENNLNVMRESLKIDGIDTVK
ncbi:hypothetical protein [Mucilaginibacter jinjuensis]|uniref:Glycosyltransferase involved in cell wall biosynthesis n=1 Tax=Mucilaginibacter jinjuensis TaxID=1176721 RepID=A0ABY7TBU1_9SPHI|nr:hypothetical protein [Mucilaginibacter jinjuensis]WCT13832.1 hypothetical protein PQO05_07795 [Mucilaginibacter jinjuensis]